MPLTCLARETASLWRGARPDMVDAGGFELQSTQHHSNLHPSRVAKEWVGVGKHNLKVPGCSGQ